jgi:single-strand DNA-binding protein
MNTIIGRITKNAEINTVKNDRQVVNFSVAINDSYKTKQGERRELTTYYNCSYWISPNVAKILTKGSLVELTGRASSSAWIGKDGEIRSGLNFHTSYIQLHSSGKNVESEPKQNAEGETNNPFAGDEEDDLPF